jgi:hypothetical protein
MGSRLPVHLRAHLRVRHFLLRAACGVVLSSLAARWTDDPDETQCADCLYAHRLLMKRKLIAAQTRAYHRGGPGNEV